MNPRRARLVRPHPPLHDDPEARRAGLDGSLALVLSTWRPDSDDLVLDIPLWTAAMTAVDRLFPGAVATVGGRPRRRWGGLLPDKEGEDYGCLADYLTRLAAEPDATPPPDRVTWRREGVLVCLSRDEAWYSVGGPSPYHDSWTTAFRVSPARMESLAGALAAAIREAGGELEG